MNAQGKGGSGKEEQVICPGLYFTSTPPGDRDILILLDEKKIMKESVTVIMEVIEKNKDHFRPSLN